MAKSNVRVSRDWFSEMRRLFDSAHYRRAAELYDEVIKDGERPTNDAILLRARIFLKTDSKRIVPFLLKEELQKPTQPQGARRAMYLGTGYARLGEFAEADKHFVKAKAVFREGPALAELAAHMTRRYSDQRDFEQAEQWRKKSLLDRSLRGKIRSEHLAAYIHARREQYREQAESLIQVLNLIGDKREQFVEDWYAAVHTLSVLARDCPWPRRRSAPKRKWIWTSTGRAILPRAYSSRSRPLRGVRLWPAMSCSCLRYLRIAQHVDIGRVWRVILYLDRSFFASVVGEHQWAVNEFSAAEELAEGIEWDETSGDERVALLLLAELAARHAPKRAPFYIARFNNLGKLRSHLQHFAFDDRLQAMAAYATGIVKIASGDEAAAEGPLRTAWGVFDRIGYDVRAGLAAIGLHHATGKARWLALAEDKLERYPRSWMARSLGEMAPAVQTDETTALSKQQAVVMRLVCEEGLSTEAMAQRLGLSPNTVLNHLKVVYSKLGVNSRAALVVEARRRKLVG